MKIILVSDIFGRTPPLLELASAIHPESIILDPYRGKIMDFKNEDQAYKYFMSNIGLKNYETLLNRALDKIKSPILLIGFSVGATAIWNISEDQHISNSSRAICYYGSQIRQNTNINPPFEIELIFPIEETSFSIADLIEKIRNTANTTIRQVSYLHGFMNKLSINFDKVAYDNEVQALVSLANSPSLQI